MDSAGDLGRRFGPRIPMSGQGHEHGSRKAFGGPGGRFERGTSYHRTGYYSEGLVGALRGL